MEQAIELLLKRNERAPIKEKILGLFDRVGGAHLLDSLYRSASL